MNENFKITHINSECKDASRCEPHGEIGKVSYFPNENFKDCGSCRNNSDNWNVDIGETQGTCDICSGKRSNKNFKDWKILAISILDEDQTKHAYKAADIIVSRAGASGIFEIAAMGKPSILVPLPSAAGDHQSKNAYAYANTGAAQIIEQENLTPHFFVEKLQLLFLHPEQLEKMHQAALAFAKPLAARAIAREILEFLMIK